MAVFQSNHFHSDWNNATITHTEEEFGYLPSPGGSTGDDLGADGVIRGNARKAIVRCRINAVAVASDIFRLARFRSHTRIGEIILVPDEATLGLDPFNIQANLGWAISGKDTMFRSDVYAGGKSFGDGTTNASWFDNGNLVKSDRYRPAWAHAAKAGSSFTSDPKQPWDLMLQLSTLNSFTPGFFSMYIDYLAGD